MDLFSAAFRPSYVPKLNEISFRNLNSLNDWLIEGKNYYIPNNHPSNEIIICVNDLSDFLRPHAFEINRLSCASIESINDINSSDFSPKFLGWNITKYYYSAFFSAHCILKVLNKGVSNIENNTIDKIKRITTTCGYFYSSINSGLYCIDINSHTRSIRFFKNNRYGDNHEGLWRLFLDFLNEFKIKVYSVLPVFEAECVNEKIEELIEGLCFWGSNGGNWLSRIRNTINYSHKFGVWFPYEGYIKDYEQIVLMKDLNMKNAMQIDLRIFKGQDLLYFVAICQLINSICFELLNDLNHRHPDNKSFVNNGIIKYSNLYIKKTPNTL